MTSRRFNLLPCALILSALLLSSCSINTSRTFQQEEQHRNYLRLGSLAVEQFELGAIAYREGATSRSGSTATGGCGCN